MANIYTQILYHVVFSVKDRANAIKPDRRDDLYAYIWGIHKKLDCHLYRIGGVENHVHILMSLHKSLPPTRYIEQVKIGSTGWIRRETVFAHWPGWQDGYGAFTASWRDKDDITEYIKSQEEHHRTVTFEEEYRALLMKAEIDFDERYLL